MKKLIAANSPYDVPRQLSVGKEAHAIIDIEPGAMAFIETQDALRTVTGSGVAVCLFNRRKRMAGMNHFVFPRTDDPKKATGKFGNAALIGLFDLFAQKNAAEELLAYIAGGACCDEFEIDTAVENLRIAWRFLFVKKISIVNQHIGGYSLREASFDLTTGIFTVKKWRQG